jgi:hypothetical protein
MKNIAGEDVSGFSLASALFVSKKTNNKNAIAILGRIRPQFPCSIR